MTSALENDLARACKLLESASPQAMDDGAAALEAVVRDLTLRRDSIDVQEALRLREGARKARLLLNLAARFHARWYDILAGMAGGYTARGSPAALSTRARISVSG